MSVLNAGRELNHNNIISSRITYIGSVVDNNDPKKLQRVKVRIHDIHRNVEDKYLPWCLPLSLLTASNTTIGKFGPVPTLNSRVYIAYLDDSPYYPVYMGGTVSEDRKLEEFTSGDLGDSYPHAYGYIDRSGNRLAVDTEKDLIDFTHVSGTRISVDGSGHVHISVTDNSVGPNASTLWPRSLVLNVVGDSIINVENDTSLRSGGDIKIHAQGNVDIAGARIDLNTNAPEPPQIGQMPARQRPLEETLPEDDITY